MVVSLKNLQGLEFFQKIEKYVGDTWNKFNRDGFVECPISNFVYTKDEFGGDEPAKAI
jgi:hypothetical protein